MVWLDMPFRCIARVYPQKKQMEFLEDCQGSEDIVWRANSSVCGMGSVVAYSSDIVGLSLRPICQDIQTSLVLKINVGIFQIQNSYLLKSYKVQNDTCFVFSSFYTSNQLLQPLFLLTGCKGLQR